MGDEWAIIGLPAKKAGDDWVICFSAEKFNYFQMRKKLEKSLFLYSNHK